MAWKNQTSRGDVVDVMTSGLTLYPWNTKGGSITVPLTSGLTGFESAVWQLTIFAKQTIPNQSNRRSMVQ